MILHVVYVIGIMGYILVRGPILLFIYINLCVYFFVLVMYIHVVFISFPYFYILYAYFFGHVISNFLPTNCVTFNHNWMKSFGGCMHMFFTICSYMCILKYVYLI